MSAYSTPIGWYIGVGLGIGSSIVSNVGVNIQKLAHRNREEEVQEAAEHLHINQNTQIPVTVTTDSNLSHDSKPTDEQQLKELQETIKKQQKSYLFDCKWIWGLILQITGAFMDFSALSVAPASVVAPLGSLTLVTNVCLAPLMHNERLSNLTMIATFLIISGTITTVIFSPRTVAVTSTNEVFDLFKTNAFIAYAIPTSAILCVTLFITRYMSFLKKKNDKKYSSNNYKLHRFMIATLSGTMGAQNVFFAKCVSTLLLFSAEGNGKLMFLYWESYVIIIAMFTTIYFQLKWLNEGLQNFSALHIVPVFQSFWITVSVIGGLSVYQEFTAMRFVDKIVFPVGVIVTIVGVALLTSQQKPKQRKEPNHTKKVDSLSHEQAPNDSGSSANSSSNGDNMDRRVEIELKSF